MFTPDDHRHMARALQLAARGLFTTDPNPRVGCVVVRDGVVVGEGWHMRAGSPHAEVHALHEAGDAATGATVYVTLEPCSHHGRTPPCAHALVDAGVARVVVAMQDPNPLVAGQGLQALRDAGIEVQAGLLEDEAASLNPGFIMRMRQARPWLRCKLAMSLDGRTAMASGESRWITGPAARADVHRLRARSSAVMTGIGTVLADDPSLTARLAGHDDGSLLQPLRVVLDSGLQLPPAAKLLQQPGETLVVTGVESPEREAALARPGVSVVTLPTRDGRPDLAAVLQYLARLEVNEVHLEAGARLSGALLDAGLVDELVIYMAPHLMGDAARGLFHLPVIGEMAQRIQLEVSDIRSVGEDWRITARVASQDEAG